MRMKRKLLASMSVPVLLLVMATGAGGAASPFKVNSSLDGKTVLPHRVYWLGYPALATAKVAKVEFLVDGKLGWVEHHAPYVYGADDNGRNRGYLVTSWLAAGTHRF